MGKKKIGIVGAGLAGLTAAYRLKQVGIESVIYEGSMRAGGRVLTGQFPNGQLFQKGGEFIDTGHEDIIQLVDEMGLELTNVIEAETPGTKEVFRVIDYDLDPPRPVIYTIEEATEDYKKVFPQVAADAEAAYPGETFETNTASTALDKFTLEQYVDQICSILRPDGKGALTKYAQLLKGSYTEEFGSEPHIQSCLNLIFLMGFGDPDVFSLFGPSDEALTITGGNSLLVKKLVEKLSEKPHPVKIKYGQRLTAVERLENGNYRLFFDDKGQCKYTDHERVLLTIPFATMRKTPGFEGEYVNLNKSQFSPLKLYAIQNLGMGINSKLTVQFKNRYWRDLGYNGSTHAISYQSTWEGTRGQEGETGILVNYTGGDYAKNFKTAALIENPEERNFYVSSVTNDFLAKLRPVYPDPFDNFEFITPENITNVNVKGWLENPWSRGSYSFYSQGQYSGGTGKLLPDGKSYPPGSVVPFANTEYYPEPQSEKNPKKRNCHFAGEHTTLDFQGYMNGAVFSGNRAALEIIEALLPTKSKVSHLH